MYPPTPYPTREQYLELDRQSERPNEYFDSEMFPIEAASARHSKIQFNLGGILGEQLRRNEQCVGLGSTIRVHIPGGRDTYPDMVVGCGKQEYRDSKNETLLNPIALFEILSPTTMNYDLGLKSDMYRSIPSLAEYVVIEQSQAKVRRIIRQPANKWLLEEFAGLDAIVPIEAIGCRIPLCDLYYRIEFDPTESLSGGVSGIAV